MVGISWNKKSWSNLWQVRSRWQNQKPDCNYVNGLNSCSDSWILNRFIWLLDAVFPYFNISINTRAHWWTTYTSLWALISLIHSRTILITSSKTSIITVLRPSYFSIPTNLIWHTLSLNKCKLGIATCAKLTPCWWIRRVVITC